MTSRIRSTSAICASLPLAVFACSPVAWASIPACALHLAQPAPGETLTPMQLAANQSCLAELKQEDEATERVAKIYAAESKMVDPEIRASAPVRTSSSSSASPATAAPPPTQQSEQSPDEEPLPRVAQILVDGARASASLRLQDGSSVEVFKNSLLPGGAVVVSISPDTVFVRRGGRTLRLPYDDGTAQRSSSGIGNAPPHFRFPVAQATRP